MATAKFKAATFRLEPAILAGLDAVKQRDGIPASEQVRRALRAWLDAKGIPMTRSSTSTSPRSRPRTPRARQHDRR